MNSYSIVLWTRESRTVQAGSLRAAFEENFGGPVTETGYNNERVWFAEDGNTGTVMNDQGDECATITLIKGAGIRVLEERLAKALGI